MSAVSTMEWLQVILLILCLTRVKSWIVNVVDVFNSRMDGQGRLNYVKKFTRWSSVSSNAVSALVVASDGYLYVSLVHMRFGLLIPVHKILLIKRLCSWGYRVQSVVKHHTKLFECLKYFDCLVPTNNCRILILFAYIRAYKDLIVLSGDCCIAFM